MRCGEGLEGRLRGDAKLCVCVPLSQRLLVGCNLLYPRDGSSPVLGSPWGGSRDEEIWAMSALVKVLLPARAGPEVWSPKMGRGARAAAGREVAGETRILGCGDPGFWGCGEPRVLGCEDPGFWDVESTGLSGVEILDFRVWRSRILGCEDPGLCGVKVQDFGVWRAQDFGAWKAQGFEMWRSRISSVES